jgi:hypothetical protein
MERTKAFLNRILETNTILLEQKNGHFCEYSPYIQQLEVDFIDLMMKADVVLKNKKTNQRIPMSVMHAPLLYIENVFLHEAGSIFNLYCYTELVKLFSSHSVFYIPYAEDTELLKSLVLQN